MNAANPPKHCDPTAYMWFQQCLPNLETTQGLVAAAVAMSRHAVRDASPPKVTSEIIGLAKQVQSRVRSKSPHAILAHLHDVLFDEGGFRGNTADYYNPRNSYLSVVLATHVGIPITLCLIYKAVAEQLGLAVRGINTPVHFLVEVTTAQEVFLVDPFHAGRLLTRDEARGHLEELIGAKLPDDAQLFLPANHELWIGRMLRNLQSAYSLRGDLSDTQAMQELETCLQAGRTHD